jgi:hypothetical protein
MSDTTSDTSSTTPGSTPPSTVPPSPTIASIKPEDISEQDRAEAARIKTEAGAAFKSACGFPLGKKKPMALLRC